ncbi:carbohydrate kinase family protein [Herbiconiux sp. L3-i23]|uniref:carbohydrate kinase family protein n=1 Tax=Herbiconiux sp. L3-i23 TaxID=2905871 RepID=UPI00205A2A2C|nr:carbohydrate kinase family protein [Herbiconiux sp. L3-i23]BDI22086.1 sugar kinase [Herbiconiux sp. L3-i23]
MSGLGHVVVLGDVVDDILVRASSPVVPDSDTDALIERRPGGSGANAAAWLAAEGLPVRFVGTVHRDDVDRHTALLRDAGVDARLDASDDLTGTIVVMIEGGSRHMYTSRGANLRTGPHLVTDDLLDGASHLHFTGYSVFAGADPSSWNDVIDRAHAAGATVSVDPGSVSYLEKYGALPFIRAVSGADLLLPNLDEGLLLGRTDDAQTAVETLRGLFPVVALTHGRGGAIVAQGGGEVFEVLSLVGPDEVVDTTGAGDAFTAGFLAGWLPDRGTDAALPRAATRGMEAAARAIRSIGARPRRPPSA